MHDDSAHIDRPNESTRRSRRLPGAIVFIAAWVIASQWTASLSEAFYFIVPFAFAAWAIVGRRKAPLIATGIGAAAWATMLALDRFSPSDLLQPYERSVIVFALLAILVIAACIWDVVAGLIRRVFPVNSASSTGRRLVARLVSILVFALIVNAQLMAAMETHWPKRLGTATPAGLHLPYERVTFTSHDSLTLVGWFIRADGSDRTAIVCHGVGADKSDMLEFAYALHDGGYNVLTFDSRGHGESDGHTVTYGNRESADVLTAVDFLQEKYPSQTKHIVGVGWSMGASTLILAAARDSRIEALHVDAAYARTFDIARVIAKPFPPVFRQVGLYLGTAIGCLETGTNLFTLAPVKSIGKIAPRPIMLIHGDADTMIPISQGEMLFAAAGDPKSWHVVQGAGHCQTLSVESPRYEQRMITFLDEALASPPSR